MKNIFCFGIAALSISFVCMNASAQTTVQTVHATMGKPVIESSLNQVSEQSVKAGAIIDQHLEISAAHASRSNSAAAKKTVAEPAAIALPMPMPIMVTSPAQGNTAPKK